MIALNAIHLIHPKIADGECSVGDVGRAQFTGARALGDVAPLGRDFGEARSVRIGNDGSDHAVVHCDGHAHIHVLVQTNSFERPTGVQPRMLQQHARHECNQQIGVRNPARGVVFRSRR